MDGKTQPRTYFDLESGSIVKKRLHPRIAAYNDMIVFLMKCNMDIKFVGSGDAAKAFLMYLGDYITKSPLSMHAGLSAMLGSIKKLDERQSGDSKSALTTIANDMMGKQEFSQPQVMSYLIGGGDCYKSDMYQILHLPPFFRVFDHHYTSITGRIPEYTSTQPSEHAEMSDPDMTTQATAELPHSREVGSITIGPGEITLSRQLTDYVLRPRDDSIEGLSLYEYFSKTQKLKKANRMPSSARAANAKGRFIEGHAEKDTHFLQIRKNEVTLVLQGASFPAPNSLATSASELRYRYLCVLFLPWRAPQDLLFPGDTWESAFQRNRPLIPPEMSHVIENLDVLSDCNDTRERLPRTVGPSEHIPDFQPEWNEDDDAADYVHPADENHDEDANDPVQVEANPLEEALGQHHADLCALIGIADIPTSFPTSESNSTFDDVQMTDVEEAQIDLERSAMSRAREQRRPDPEHSYRSIFSTNPVEPAVEIATISDSSSHIHSTEPVSALSIARRLITEMNMADNPEQSRSLITVASHLDHPTDQLLMYVGGVGGTGKSYVIKSMVKLFAMLKKGHHLMLSAPTGIAAVLIGGHTIHALTLLPEKRQSRKNIESLVEIWRDVRYLVIDEISMISAGFLYQVSTRLQQAKGDADGPHPLPFGGINVVFTGDFAQLKPVKGEAVYAYNSSRRTSFRDATSQPAMTSLSGGWLWRQLNAVVILTRNIRQSLDPDYSALLSRVRTGTCIQSQAFNERSIKTAPGQLSDYDVLLRRTIGYQTRAGSLPHLRQSFRNAPIIVGKKFIRDRLNLTIVRFRAAESNQQVTLSHSVDTFQRSRVKGSLRKALWDLYAGDCENSWGKLPLFIGMRVMITTNLAILHSAVNGAEGIVRGFKMERRHGVSTAKVVYVEIPGAGHIAPGLPEDWVPIFPEKTSFKAKILRDGSTLKCNISRFQLPLTPAYCYTDYKAQGRSMDYAIVDLQSARTLQGVYVMLSRVRTLSGLAIMQPFMPSKIYGRLSQELRDEMRRLEALADETAARFPLA